MLKLVGFCLRVLIFSIAILVLGNWLRWDGKTLSDQIKHQMSHAESSRFAGAVRDWAEKVTHDTRSSLPKSLDHSDPEEEDISPSERQKLKALIRELNSSHKKN